jgi:hypothetical protein
MKTGVIEADSRHVLRRMHKAMQGNAIRALVELITNSDDSYIRLARESRPDSAPERIIEVLYCKEGYAGVFAVRDFAEGMSEADVDRSFTKYGAATSGLEEGNSVRGYFGEGAKDSLATMLDGRICTFKDGQFVECRLYVDEKTHEPKYAIDDPIPAVARLRSIHGVDGNGTVAHFKADPAAGHTVPRFTTVQEELSNNYQLRKIMMNPDKRVMLIGEDGTERRLHVRRPKPSIEVSADDFEVTYDGLSFTVHVSIWRADHELRQSGEDRDGGLLLVDDGDAVLGITLFRFETEPLAAQLFGEVRIGGFRQLLEREEAVLSERRDGLEASHPFCKAIIPKIEALLEKQVAQERKRRQQDSTKVDKKEQERYRKAFSLLNEIAETETQSVTNLGDAPAGEVEPPPNGIALYPFTAQIQAGKRYGFELRIDTEVVKPGSLVSITTSCPGVFLVTKEVRVEQADKQVVRKYVTLEAQAPHTSGKLEARTGDRIVEAHIEVVPEETLLLEEGMVFEPQTLTVRPNQTRRAVLHAYVKLVPDGSTITLTSDNPAVHVSPSELVVVEAEAKRNVVSFELEIWGEGTGEDAIVQAEHEWSLALLQVSVRSKEPTEPKGRKGMFSEPDYSSSPAPLQRISYSHETGQITIYLNFPTVRQYLGENREYATTLPAQVLVADMVAERCFREIARAKAERSGAAITPEGLRELIERDANELARKYGSKIHQALVDQDLLKVAKLAAQPT